jgi:hypothetical protein
MHDVDVFTAMPKPTVPRIPSARMAINAAKMTERTIISFD